jgi:O-antigen/teichoic acid export membrane protein
VLWSYGSLTGTRLLILLSTTVLARLLAPRDFGLVALALVFTTLLDALRDLGLNPALVVAGDDDLDEQAGTAFSVTLLIGIGLAVLIAAVSPLAAAFFDQLLDFGKFAAGAQNIIHQENFLARFHFQVLPEVQRLGFVLPLGPIHLTGAQRFAYAVRYGKTAGSRRNHR